MNSNSLDLSNYIEKNALIKTVAEAAQATGTETYLIGGYVRDLLLRRPSKDMDFVCIGSGITLAEQVAARLGEGASLSVFKNFGTAQVKRGEHELEFVGARKESYRSDSRKPIVENGTLGDDQNRRDFTINAMGIGLNANNYGHLIDPFGGQQDLKRRIIRTPLPPEQTFSDDPLRIMRAMRFASQLGFDIAPETFEAIAEQRERIKIVSTERITTELNKIILSGTPSYGFKLMDAAGLLDIFFPEFVRLKGVELIEGKGHKDNFYHTLKVLDNLSEMTDDLWLRWAAILHDIAKPATKRFYPKAGWTFHGHEEKGARMVRPIFKRLKLPLNEKMKQVEKLVRLHLRPIALVKDTTTDSAIRRLLFDTGDDLEGLMMLCRADITSKNPDKVKRYIANFDKLEKKIDALEQRDKIRNFQPVITGEVIMETFGLKPSREVGDIKTEVREAILDGIIRNEFEEAYAHMLKIAEKKGLSPKKDLRM